MKKSILAVLFFLLGLLSTLPASAIENEFGGYWNTRAISMNNFSGTDSGTFSIVDTRTRLYYTAKLNESLKFVNKFEIDNIWGDDVGGDIGADGELFEVKNSYIDVTLASHNFKIGIQPGQVGRGFLFDDDFSGVTAQFNAGSMSLPIIWMKVSESDLGTSASIHNIRRGWGRDYFILNPTFNLSDKMKINPFLFFDKEQGTDTNIFYLGADIEAKMDNVGAWATAIFQTGEIAIRDTLTGEVLSNNDTTGFLVAAGADAGIVHGQFFYATGDDDPNDDEINDFTPPTGRSYYWAEIMGYGYLDYAVSNGSPADGISNVMAVNIGTTVKPMDKLSLAADLWYAQLAEDNVNGDTELGFEIDLRATYSILDNLSLDVIGAYLISGDATGDEDAFEVGTQLSFGF